MNLKELQSLAPLSRTINQPLICDEEISVPQKLLQKHTGKQPNLRLKAKDCKDHLK